MAVPPPMAHLRVVSDGATWRVSVGDGQSPPVEAMCAALKAELELPVPRVLLAGSDASVAAGEAAYAQRLADTLAGASAAWAHLQVLKGRAEAKGQPLVVAVHGPPDVRWELLSLGRGSLEEQGSGMVVRWAAGAAPTARPAYRRASVWDATMDAASQRVSTSARSSMEGAGLTLVESTGRPSLLWVVAHGERGTHALEVAMGAGGAGVSAVSAALGSALEHALVVVLGMCHAASASQPGAPAMVEPLLAAGVPVVIAPTGPVPVEMLEHFASGMAEALADGRSVADMVAAGRRAVRAWAFPHPLARWSVMRCYVGRLDALSAVLCPQSWVPEGWPIPRADAAAWLHAAQLDALRRTDGYVGLEHLLRTVTGVVGGETCAATLRRCAAMWLRPYEEASAGLLPQGGHAADLRPTPRLRGLGEALRPGFSLEGLAAAVLGQPTLTPLGAVPGDSKFDTLRTLESSAPPAAPEATALEVVGGPEDGRIIELAGEFVLGRAGGQADVQLYAGTRLTDRKLSRRHLEWSGGRLRSERSLEVHGPEGVREGGAPLRHGDLIAVTGSTRLRALARG